MKTKKPLKIIGIAIFLYLGYAAAFYFLQTFLLYHPDSTDFQQCPAFAEDEKIEHNNTRLYHQDNQGDLLVFYHGNAGRACDRAQLLEQKRGEDSYVIVEYTGFGEQGRPDKEQIKQDVENTIDYLENYEEEDVYVMGNSIGTGPASLHASKTETNGLILINPFYSVESWYWTLSPLYPDQLLTEKYNNSKYLQNVTEETLILHAENDRVIPPSESKKLEEEHQLQREIISDRRHNNIFQDTQYQQKITEFLNNTEN